jgi:hypothetical protein
MWWVGDGFTRGEVLVHSDVYIKLLFSPSISPHKLQERVMNEKRVSDQSVRRCSCGFKTPPESSDVCRSHCRIPSKSQLKPSCLAI